MLRKAATVARQRITRTVAAVGRRVATPTVYQLAGAVGIAWGAWGVSPELGKAVGGVALLVFGVAAERGGG